MMNEDGFDFKSMLAILYKGRKLIIGSVLLCIFSAALLALIVPDVWTARVQVEQKRGFSPLYIKLSGLKYLLSETLEWAEFEKNFNSNAALKEYFRVFNSPLNQQQFFDSLVAHEDGAVQVSSVSFSATEYNGEFFSGEIRVKAPDAETVVKMLNEYIRFTDTTFTQQQEKLAKVFVDKKRSEFQEGISLLTQRAKSRSTLREAPVQEPQISVLRGNIVALDTFAYGSTDVISLADLSTVSEPSLQKTMAKPGVLVTLGLMAGLFIGLSLVLFFYYLRVQRGFKGLVYE